MILLKIANILSFANYLLNQSHPTVPITPLSPHSHFFFIYPFFATKTLLGVYVFVFQWFQASEQISENCVGIWLVLATLFAFFRNYFLLEHWLIFTLVCNIALLFFVSIIYWNLAQQELISKTWPDFAFVHGKPVISVKIFISANCNLACCNCIFHNS